MKREKRTGPRTNPSETFGGLEKSDFCDFDKPRKHIFQQGRTESTNKARREANQNKLWKIVGCQTESKASEKSIASRIVPEPGFGLLNPSETN